MRERPILFGGRMVQAILEGRKTQTRRPMKRQPVERDEFVRLQGGYPDGAMRAVFDDGEIISGIRCPFGQDGDRLWVRETWCELRREHYEDPSQPRDVLCSRYQFRRNGVAYRADTTPDGEEIRVAYGYIWRPSIHMPRWASRLTLEVTGVRVERLADISENDARAEGCREIRPSHWVMPGTAYDRAGLCHNGAGIAFAVAWDETYGADAANANPWVWVIDFKRAEG